MVFRLVVAFCSLRRGGHRHTRADEQGVSRTMCTSRPPGTSTCTRWSTPGTQARTSPCTGRLPTPLRRGGTERRKGHSPCTPQAPSWLWHPGLNLSSAPHTHTHIQHAVCPHHCRCSTRANTRATRRVAALFLNRPPLPPRSQRELEREQSPQRTRCETCDESLAVE